MNRTPKLILLLSFFAIIAGVPILQGVLEHYQEEESPRLLNLFKQVPSENNLRAFEKELDEASFFGQKIRPMFQVIRYALLKDLGEKALRGLRGWYFYHPEVRYLSEPYFRNRSPEPSNTDPVETIVDFDQQLKARGIQLLVIPVPSKASIYPEQLVSSLNPSSSISIHTQTFINELQRRAVDVLSLHPIFLKARQQLNPKTSLFMATDTHWTGDGVKLAAEVIAAHLKEQNWYQTLPPASRYLRRELQVTRQGDILKMTQIPWQEKFFTQEAVHCYQVTNKKTGTPYEDAEDAPILLLGDSFSRIFQTDEPNAAGLIANLAYELQLPLSSIVNDGGASTLVRQELARSPELLKGKRLILWAFTERDIRFGLNGWQPIKL